MSKLQHDFKVISIISNFKNKPKGVIVSPAALLHTSCAE